MRNKLILILAAILMLTVFGGAVQAQPAAPLLRTPAHREVVSEGRVTFSWSAVPGDTRYRLRIVKLTPGARPQVVVNRNVRNITRHTVPAAILDGSGTDYRWQVRARNALGLGPWSTHRFFSVGELGVPVLLSPQGSSNQPGTAVTFSWEPVENALQYRLVVVDIDNREVFFSRLVGNVTEHTVTGFPNDGTRYRWRVRAFNRGGAGPLSTARRFVNSGNISGAVTYDWSRKVEEMVEPFDPTVLNLTDARGNRYTLHIPLEADLFGIDVAMVAVQSIEDFPMSGGLLGGVGLLPDGLVLIEPATLVVKPADSSAVEEWLQSSPDHRLLGYTHAEDGEYFHYYPYTIHGDEIHFTVPCFRGFGLGLATGDDIARHLARPAMTAAIEANRAAAPVFGDLAARRFLGNPSASFSDAEKTALTQVYNRWFDQRVGLLCTEGEADVESLDQAIIEYLQWVAAVTQSGTDHTQRNRQALNTIERGISNYLSRVQSSAWGARELTLPIASAQDQSQFEQRRKELYASLARIYGLDNLDSILENMGRGFDFILKSTITFNEGTEDEIRVSVRSDPVLLNWSKIIDHVPRLSTLVGTAAIRHTDFYIPWEDDECYDVIYHLTPGTIKVELFPARNALRATPEGVGFTIKFLSNEEFVQRSFVVIRIMPLEAGFTIIDICGDPPDPPRTTPTAPVWLGSFSVFHQDTLFSEGMLFRNWQCTPTPPGFSGILEFDQVGAYGVRERTTMRYYSP